MYDFFGVSVGEKDKVKGAGLGWLLGPGPGHSWQWLMRSDWAVHQCSGGTEPCSPRETFQPLSPLSGAIHSTEYSPQGWGGGVDRRPGRSRRRREGGWRTRGQPTPSDLVNQPGLVWDQGSKNRRCVCVYRYIASIFECKGMTARLSACENKKGSSGRYSMYVCIIVSLFMVVQKSRLCVRSHPWSKFMFSFL